MAVDTTRIRAYVNGLVAVSGYGVVNPTLPTDATTSLNSSIFKEVGTLSDSGTVSTSKQNFNNVYMWQNNAARRSPAGPVRPQLQVHLPGAELPDAQHSVRWLNPDAAVLGRVDRGEGRRPGPAFLGAARH